MARNSIMVDLDDPQAEKIAGVLSNKTAKKILSMLADRELSGSEIASELNMPLNTVTYNLKNLTEAGLIERSKRLFWSSKGKKMEMYRVVNKRIVISPKKMIKGIVPAVLFSAVIAGAIKFWIGAQLKVSNVATSLKVEEKMMDTSDVADTAAESVGSIAAPAADTVVGSLNQSAVAIAQSVWLWFFVGALFALLIYLMWNWRKQ